MSISKIQNDIAKGNFSTTELNNLITFIQETKRTPGVVLSIKIKKAIVEMRGQRYNVPLSMLEAA